MTHKIFILIAKIVKDEMKDNFNSQEYLDEVCARTGCPKDEVYMATDSLFRQGEG